MSKESAAKTPYDPPGEDALFDFSELTRRQLHQDLNLCGKEPMLVSNVRKGAVGEAPLKEYRREEQLGPPRRRKAARSTIQPQTARDYLLAARTTARDKNLTAVAEIEARRLQKELNRERAINAELESQLEYHEAALQEFLQHHYREVTDTITKGDEARKGLTEQEVKIKYFSGLLAESQTVQEEEEERLQELTAFQQFLAAVNPDQSLRDLRRRIVEIEEDVKTQKVNCENRTVTNSVELSEAAVTLAITSSGINSPVGESGSVSALATDLVTLRMMRPPQHVSRSSSDLDYGKPPSPQMQVVQVDEASPLLDNTDICDASAFEDFIADNERLVALSHMYESQCHALLALLTRLRGQTEAINKEMETRQKKLSARLLEIQQLQEKASGNGHECQLRDLQTLIKEWPNLSGDSEAQAQLDQLVAQIAEVVSDVFGSSEYSPLVPQAQPSSSRIYVSGSAKGRSKSNDSGGSPKREGGHDMMDGAGSTVSAGMGQEALLALLEARVTDLCASLDTIDSSLRDAIFLNCEQARSARLKEEKRQETEMRRAERKQKHLERALAEPPPKPL